MNDRYFYVGSGTAHDVDVTTSQTDAVDGERGLLLREAEAWMNGACGPFVTLGHSPIEVPLWDVDMESALSTDILFYNKSPWVGLDVDMEHGRALLISRDIILQTAYHVRFTSITWENCSLRRWLNTSFFDSLDSQVKSRVLEVTNLNPDNKGTNIPGGNPTKDRVFLLSIDEVRTYFKSDFDRVAKFYHWVNWWWLRSPGSHEYCAAYVHRDGSVQVGGDESRNYSGGVRPALWLNLDA